jgi:hypothetical protein
MGLSIVSKRLSATEVGRSWDWIKGKNLESPGDLLHCPSFQARMSIRKTREPCVSMSRDTPP